jgi:hypothetical protein
MHYLGEYFPHRVKGINGPSAFSVASMASVYDDGEEPAV